MKLFDQIDRSRNWNDEERMVLDAVQRMVDTVIAPNAAKYDETGEFPWENVEAINELGLNGIFLPAEYGGSPMSFRLYLEVALLPASSTQPIATA
jgi:alkylation response protein AidB-like acyl-CoA dehydrogenase